MARKKDSQQKAALREMMDNSKFRISKGCVTQSVRENEDSRHAFIF